MPDSHNGYQNRVQIYKKRENVTNIPTHYGVAEGRLHQGIYLLAYPGVFPYLNPILVPIMGIWHKQLNLLTCTCFFSLLILHFIVILLRVGDGVVLLVQVRCPTRSGRCCESERGR